MSPIPYETITCGAAILCENATAVYGTLTHKNPPVLDNLNMRVHRGTIYGLLGPSGCGKTTLLKCILGNLRLKQGDIRVFGHPPSSGSDLVQVPGRDVGYMPQDIALTPNFKIKEILYFFGKLNGMTGSQIREQINFITQLLDLPPEDRFVENLSGGQKRRVSFGAALVHNPKLLILDEPTVGVDPVLRSKIWKHLLNLSKSEKTTILITTHYIEEARQANRVGLMRGGVLLTEGEPEFLIKQRGSVTLEAVFLELCGGQDQDYDEKSTAAKVCESSVSPAESSGKTVVQNSIQDNLSDSDGNHSNHVSVISPTKPLQQRTVEFLKTSMFSPKHVAACVIKDVIALLRNKPVMVFQFLLPLIQISIILLAIGRNPKDVPVGIVNEDQASSKISLSEDYISYLDTELMSLKRYESMDKATSDALAGKLTAVMHFGPHFTTDLIQRSLHFTNTSVEVALGGSVYITMDQTVLITSMLLQQSILTSYANFGFDLIEQFETSPSLTISPINFTKPFYGEEVTTFTDYMAPGIVLQLTYAMSVSLTGIAAITERKIGLVDRLSAAGVTESELMLALIIVQCLVMTGQIAILFIMVLAVFQSPFLGSLVLAVLITYLQGVSGLSFGVIISAVCTEETQAVQLALGTFYPILLLSGVIWPLEAIPYPLRYLSFILPPTLPAAAIRDVFLKGWGITYQQVWEGILVNIIFILLFLLIAMLVRKVLWYKR